jgi:Cof subfamily protein (haloacid dehalogenase superfamily)
MKMIAADYDGTLNYCGKVTQEDLEALEKWQAEGNLFVIDTGRSLESIRIEAEKNGLKPSYYITNNGGMVFDNQNNELFSSYLDNDLAHEVMEMALRLEGAVSFVANDGIWRHRIIVDAGKQDHRYTLQPDMTLEELISLNRYAQIVISMDDMEKAARLAAKINGRYGENLTAFANRWVVDIVRSGVSKANGLDFLVRHLDLPVENVWTLGDADNDLPMIEYGVHGAVIETGLEEVKAKAKFICGGAADLIRIIHETE